MPPNSSGTVRPNTPIWAQLANHLKRYQLVLQMPIMGEGAHLSFGETAKLIADHLMRVVKTRVGLGRADCQH
jgi:hypothetical protein